MNRIIAAGLGPGEINFLPPKTLGILMQAENIFLRTEEHPLVEDLKKRGIDFTSFDYIYEKESSFGSVYSTIVDVLMENALSKNQIVYAVPGHPMVAEATVEMLIEAAESKCEIEIIPAMSCLDAAYALLKIDPTHGLSIRDCLSFKRKDIDTRTSLLLTQLYNRQIASNVKLTLMEHYSDTHPVKVVKEASIQNREKVLEIPLYELDRIDEINHLTSLYVPEVKGSDGKKACLSDLEQVMERLRGPDGCPWDREQNHDSLRRYLIEETYEVIDAVEENNMHKLQEELGDLLLQIIFHAQIAKENNEFSMEEIIGGIVEKLVRRHPHVFGTKGVDGAKEVSRNWEKIKQDEKKGKYFFDIPRRLPALMRAEKIQNKASRIGFDWPSIEGAWDKVDEEIRELRSAVFEKESKEEVLSEVGDVLFSIVNACRFLNIEPEEALGKTVDKFIKRFTYIEERADAMGKSPEDLSLDQLDELWEEAKHRKN